MILWGAAANDEMLQQKKAIIHHRLMCRRLDEAHQLNDKQVGGLYQYRAC
jgi:hypothetical protein